MTNISTKPVYLYNTLTRSKAVVSTARSATGQDLLVRPNRLQRYPYRQFPCLHDNRLAASHARIQRL